MHSKKFNQWLDKFLKEKEIDLKEIFIIEKNGNKHIFKIENVIDMIKLASSQEKEEIKKMFLKLDYESKNIKNYIKHLGNALVDTYEKIENEENEEAM